MNFSIFVVFLLAYACLIQGSRFNDVLEEIEWRNLKKEAVSLFYDQRQIDSISQNPFDPHKRSSCNTESLPEYCCIGSTRSSRMMHWCPETCHADKANFFLVPEFKEEFAGAQLRPFEYSLNLLKQHGKVLAHVGDSVGNQMISALECSFRTGNQTQTMMSREFYGKMNSARGLLMNTNYTFASQSSNGLVMDDTMWKPDFNGDHLHRMIRVADVIIANFGLHYDERKRWQFKTDVTQFFSLMYDFASDPSHVFIWRETSAQHWFGTGGEYHGRYSEKMRMNETTFELKRNSKQCQSHIVFDEKLQPKWRTQIVKDKANQLGYSVIELGDPEAYVKMQSNQPRLFILPFYDLSLSRPDLHPENMKEKQCDAVHFCYYPYFWKPLEENLARILDVALSY